MTDQRLDNLLRDSYREIKRLRSRLKQVREQAPIAVVGMACRAPGIHDLSDYWQVLTSQSDVIGPCPDRWPGVKVDSTAQGGFLTAVEWFDPEFFSLSPREAIAMEPQQRLALELSWEALESAGLQPAKLAGSQTGVYLGAASSQYGWWAQPQESEGYQLTGLDTSVLSGRVAFQLDLRGPTMTVNTACSSSLVSLHLACQALRLGECDLALAGGVCVMCHPGVFSEFRKLDGLAGDGRCKSFSARADGVGWSEGAGILVLKRLDEVKKNDKVLALIKGSAVNQDGRTLSLTAPNGPSQQSVIESALSHASVEPSTVDAVEAHGTGTVLGDPIEAGALENVFGPTRPQNRPLWLGSSKSHLGHTQAAAGALAVIKMILALGYETLPPTLHCQPPTPSVDWKESGLALLEKAQPWSSDPQRPRRSGISSFGMSGTNAHLILEEAPLRESEQQPPPDSPAPLLISARGAKALRARAAQWHGWLKQNSPPWGTFLRSAGSRGHLPFRAAIEASDPASALEPLEALAQGLQHPRVRLGSGAQRGNRVVFVFSGHGGQWPEMGRQLLHQSEPFREVIESCDRALRPHVDWSLLELLRHNQQPHPGGVRQIVLFALGLGLARVCQNLGLEPSAVVGHSLGEITAATVAGALSLEEGSRLIAARASLVKPLCGQGFGMLATSLERPRLEGLLPSYAGLEMAASNSASSSVVSGDNATLAQLEEALRAEGVGCRKVDVDWACHSRQLDPVLGPFREALGEVEHRQPQIPMFSTLTGEWVEERYLDADYWVRNLREPVQFKAAVEALAPDHDLFLEIGPHPVLASALKESCPQALVGCSLRRDRAGLETLREQLLELHLEGFPLSLEQLALPDMPPLELPPYPFQRQRYWLSHDTPSLSHPLLTSTQATVAGGWHFEGRLDPKSTPWLREHSSRGQQLFPATGFLELLLSVGNWLEPPLTCRELNLEAPLSVETPLTFRLLLEPTPEGFQARLETFQGERWESKARALLGASEASPEPLSAWPPQGAVELDFERERFYLDLNRGDLYLGPAFQGLTRLWRDPDHPRRLWLEARLPQDCPRQGLHPALLDSALQGLGLLNPDRVRVPLPVKLEAHWSSPQDLTAVRAMLELIEEDPRGYKARAVIWNQQNQPVLELPLYQATLGPGPRLSRFVAHPFENRPWSALSWSRPGPQPLRGEAGLDLTEHGLSPLELCQTVLQQLQQGLPDSLTVLTRGALSQDSAEPIQDIAGAAALGMLRALGREHPELQLCLIDCDSSQASLQQIGRGPAGEFLLRQGQCWTLEPAPHPPGPKAGTALKASLSGDLQALQFEPDPARERPLKGREVRLQVRAAGLNFRDTMSALGLYPGAPRPLGGEAAGVVLEIGPAVETLTPGQAVVGLTPEGSFSSTVVTLEELLIPLPTDLSFAQGATLPIAYLTACWSLQKMAQLEPGQTVLIHSVSGGVGMAAARLARYLGARVFGTASRPKWPEVDLAPDCLSDSRSPAFKDDIMKRTEGRGVDLVLNSLTGELLDASLECVAPGGQFLELGRTDLRDPHTLKQRSLNYQVVDLEGEPPQELGRILQKIGTLVDQGALAPLPLRAYPLARAGEAFTTMAGARHVGKLVLTNPPTEIRGAVLVTGGTGGVGRCLARHLVGHTELSHLVLLSRQGLQAEGARELQRELASLNPKIAIEIKACDVRRPEQLEKVLGELPGEHPLGAIFHLAGELADATWERQSPELLEAAMGPKLEGALQLHQWTRHLNSVTHFVLFSAASGTLSGAGQAGYAAANAGLNALAQQRQSEGLPALSLLWGPWHQVGMTAQLTSSQFRKLQESELPPLWPSEALELLDQALLNPSPVLLAGEYRPGPGQPSLDNDQDLLETVRREAARVLRLPGPEAVSPERPLRELGLDSLTAIEFRNQLMARLGRKLPATLAFDYPDPNSLVAFLSPSPAAYDTFPTSSDSKVAVIGVACRAPGGVNSPEDYWELLASGRDAMEPIARRWPEWEGAEQTLAGLMSEIERFDPAFFGVSPREASSMSPEQRLSLEVAWEALERAGLIPSQLQGSRTGVYMGASRSDYGADQPLGERTVMGRAASAVSGRVSYLLDLKGPALTVDTACSSSLVALHLACGALRSGECEIALAGGVSVMNTPATFVAFDQIGASSSQGHCRPFSCQADGTTWSEGVAILVLKPLSQAVQDRDAILAVLSGSALNQDGRSQGFTAPNGPAQERVVRQALGRAQLTPEKLDAVEAHGTGTILGDPIEAGALARVFASTRPSEQPLWLGSGKSNLGHAQAAAGALGVLKMILALEHRRLPRSLYSEQPSEHINWASSGLALLEHSVPWEPGPRPRRAGVSSFGMTGTNAHLIMEEPPPISTDEEVEVLPLLISGGCPESLRQQARRWYDWILHHPEESWSGIVRTAALRRTHYEFRASLLTQNREQGLRLLQTLALGRTAPELITGQTCESQPLPEAPVQDLRTLAERHCQGAAIDWASQALAEGARVVALPPYPFQGQRYGPEGVRCEGQLYKVVEESCHLALTETDTLPLILDLRSEPHDDPEKVSKHSLSFLQDWLKGTPGQRLVVVTRGAASNPNQAPVWGLVRSLQKERPDCPLHLLDSDDSLPLERLLGSDLPPESLLRRGRLYRLVLEPYAPASLCAPLGETAGPGTVLISGATGELGRQLTRHLASAHGVRRFLLLSARGPKAPGAREWLDELQQEFPLQADLKACDMGCEHSLAVVLSQIPDSYPLVAVFHLAATLNDGIFSSLSEASLETVLGAKLRGALHLDRLTRDMADLSHFVLFSSTAGLLGSPGAANYAAANSGLDALARRRREQGLPALSLAWSRWQGTDLARRSPQWSHRLARSGMTPLSSRRALELLDQALAGREPLLVAARFEQSLETPDAPQSSLRRELESLTPRERADQLTRHVNQTVGQILGYQRGVTLPPRKGFFELGLDSLMALELRNLLSQSLELELSVTLAFESPNIEALCGQLLKQLSPPPGGTHAPEESAPAEPLSLEQELRRLEELLEEMS